MDSPSALVVDDDPQVVALLRQWLSARGIAVEGFTDPRAALDRAGRGRASLLLSDVHMPDLGGLELLRAVKETDPMIEVIMFSGAYSVEEAVCAIKLGAFDYITKPFDLRALDERLRQLEATRQKRERTTHVREERQALALFQGMVGESPRMLEIFSLVERVAKHDTTVLILGETGTGKEMVARAVHALSPRVKAPFVACNCAAIPESLLEAEFFGHERGAFTGAERRRRGLFEQASGGTLFLDEMGELPLGLQVKLLRALSTGRVTRLGSEESVPVDVRIISATNRPLSQMVEGGAFRADLYYRLAIVEVSLPPLRERIEDLPLLCRHFLDLVGKKLQKSIRGLSREAQLRLREHGWPGNIRELENVLERAGIETTRDFIGSSDLPPPLRGPTASPPSDRRWSIPPPAVDGVLRTHTPWPADLSLEAVERAHILRVLRRNDGNRIATARDLRISRSALYDKLRRLSLTGEAQPVRRGRKTREGR